MMGNKEASEDDLNRIIAMAHLDEFIRALIKVLIQKSGKEELLSLGGKGNELQLHEQ